MSLVGRYEFDEENHLHILDGKPLTGTSSVMDIISKPLTWWAVGEGLKTLGWTPIKEYINGKPRNVSKERRVQELTPKFQQLSEMMAKGDLEGFLAVLDGAYYAHSKTKDKAAVGGKELHSKLEKYVKYCIEKKAGTPTRVDEPGIAGFIEWAINNVDRFLWSEIHTYSAEHWLGGISDLGATLKDGSCAIIDFKSSKAAYPNQFWQIGGYDIQISENGGFTRTGEFILPPTKIDKHIIIPFGAPHFTVTEDKDVVANRNSFIAALHLYRENKRLSGE